MRFPHFVPGQAGDHPPKVAVYMGDEATIGIPHDESLVSIVKEKKRPRRDVNLVTPLAGKGYCFSKWKESLKQAPMKRSHVYVYDNSNNPRFSRRVDKFCESQLDSYTLIKDENSKQGLETIRDWVRVGNRCRAVYGQIYNSIVDHKRPLCLNMEDDVGIPDRAWDKLYTQIQNDEVGTVIGQCNDRRAYVDTGKIQTIAVNFKVEEAIGQTDSINVITVPAQVRQFGVDSIGAGHMGFWLTKTEVISELGMGHRVGELRGNDINWGFAINRAGWKFAIDWSVKLDHYFEVDGKVLSV